MSETCFMAEENALNLILISEISKNANIKDWKKIKPNIESILHLDI